MTPSLHIEVHFDLICPWCLIGKRHLAMALERLRQAWPEVAPRIRWQSHPLLPDIPMEGVPYQEFYERRLGGRAAVAARRAQVQEAAQPARIEFAFDRIAVMPNTLAAHRLIGWVQGQQGDGPAERLIESLFASYFMAGKDIGAPSVLLGLAKECGIILEPGSVDLAFRGMPGGHDGRFRSKHRVTGVPYYIFNDRLAISGAYPADALLEAMLQSVG